MMEHFVGRTHRLLNESGQNYFEKDWDNLIIFDATRADLFEETFDTSSEFDEYERTKSPGTSSAEWMKACFGSNTYSDTIYISGNPWISRFGSDTFHRVYNLWVDEFGLNRDATAGKENILEDHDPKGWGTIKADKLTRVAIEKQRKYPNKRLVVHYFQPHAPCIGNPDGSIKENIEHRIEPDENLRQGNTTRQEIWEAYKDNLLYAYHHSQKLINTINGKTVYSADHGELMGEWLWPFPIRGHAHPSGVNHPKLIEVPWAVHNGERRKLEEGSIEERDFDQEQINEHLEDLGYI